MPDSFDAFMTRLRTNWQVLTLVGTLSFFGTVAGADAQFRINDQGSRLIVAEAKIEANTNTIASLKQQADDIQATADRIEAKIDEMLRRR